MGEEKNNFIKSILFLGIGTLLLFFVNSLFTPRWNYPVFSGNSTDSIATFYAQDENVNQVIFLGTSHGETGISPMEIYKYSGISTYNLCTSGQPIEISYYLLKETIRTQNPNVVMLDVIPLEVP